MKAGDRCLNCNRDTLCYTGTLAGGPESLRLICHACKWRPEAVMDGEMSFKLQAWLNSEERGVTREQFDREWEEYQRARITGN